MIYATNGENFVYAFDSTLNLLWSDFVPSNNTSGVCVAPNGMAAVAGQNVIKVYAPATATALAENSVSGIRVFPNPTTQFVFIDGDEELIQHPYSLRDVHGRLVRQGALEERSSSIDLSYLPQGCYLLSFEGRNQTFRIFRN